MDELHLPACPICQARDSLSRQTRTMRDSVYVWYECAQCGSVLLQGSAGTWTYQKIGVPDMSYLLKQPLTAAQITGLAAVAAPPEPEPDETAAAWPEPEPKTAPPWPEPEPEAASRPWPRPWPEPVEEIEPAAEMPAAAPPAYDLRTEPAARQPDVAPIPAAPAKTRRGLPRLMVLAIIVLALCVLVSLAVLIMIMILNRQAAGPTGGIDGLRWLASAAAALRAVA